MVQARQRAEWSRTVAVVSWLYQGRALTADDIAPGVFELEVEPEKTPEELEAESQLAWAQMHAYFRPNAAKQSQEPGA